MGLQPATVGEKAELDDGHLTGQNVRLDRPDHAHSDVGVASENIFDGVAEVKLEGQTRMIGF